MNVKKFEYLVALEEEKNISSAAQKLYISQPSLSQFLTSTEKELGVKLFNRCKNELIPTYEGRVILQASHEIIASYRNAMARLQDITDNARGELSIGVTQERGALMLHKVYPAFHQLYPNIQLIIIEEHPNTLEERTATGKIDVSIIANVSQSPDLEYIPLCRNSMVIVVNKNNPVIAGIDFPCDGSLPEIGLEVFKDCSFINMKKKTKTYSVVSSIFEKHSFSPKIMFDTTSASTSINMVGVSDAVSLLPSAYIQPSESVRYLRLADCPSWYISAAIRKGTYINQATKAFIDITKEYLNATIFYK